MATVRESLEVDDWRLDTVADADADADAACVFITRSPSSRNTLLPVEATHVSMQITSQ